MESILTLTQLKLEAGRLKVTEMKPSLGAMAGGPSSPTRTAKGQKKLQVQRKAKPTQSLEEPIDLKKFDFCGLKSQAQEWNESKARLCSMVRDNGIVHELYPEKLYLVYLTETNGATFCKTHNSLTKPPFVFYPFEYTELLGYESFNEDFGPFNLAAIHLFCSKIKIWLDTLDHRDENGVVVVIDGDGYQTKLNGTLLASIAAMVLLNTTDEEVITNLKRAIVHKNYPSRSKELFINQGKRFCDVSGYLTTFKLTLEDCIEAFYHALKLDFYNYYQFDQIEYLFYELVMTGDLNWIVPKKILAFAGPSDQTFSMKMNQKHRPSFYYDYFRDHNVTTIIRLNDPEYDASGFTDAGFEHYDLIFPDGFPPTSQIAMKFMEIVEASKGAVAVHCYAGIGRTGTLIAAYLVVKYQFTPAQAIAWTRICRPGSVISEQQDWLLKYFDKNCPKNLLRKLTANNNKLGLDIQMSDSTEACPSSGSSSQSTAIRDLRPDMPNCQTSYVDLEKERGQAFALVQTKQKRTKTCRRPVTRSNLSSQQSDAGSDPNKAAIPKTTNPKAQDLVLDLGKTVPIQFYQCELIRNIIKLKPGQNATYTINDGVYDWKVKYPKGDYVSLQLCLPLEEDMTEELEVVDEPQIWCRFEKQPAKKAQKDQPTKMKPVMYFGKKVAARGSIEIV